MTKLFRVLGLAVLLTVALVSAVAAEDGMESRGAVARLNPGAASLEWTPLVDARLVLTVTGPGDFQVRQELAAGKAPSLSLFDAKGQKLVDGSYNWELRTAPSMDRETRRKLAEARRTGDDAGLAELRVSGKLPEGLVQSGSFAIVNGSFVTPGQMEEQQVQQPRSRPATGSTGGINNITGADQVIADDLIVQQSLCVGFDCVNGESFGFDTIRLKENNTRIKFDDTSSSAGFPNTDWQLTANDSASGGQNKFSIEDITAARVPFTIEGASTTNSIYVDSTGRIGFRTSTPVLDLHINTSNTPGIRLEQNNSGGFTAQSWDIAGNETNFFIRDVTNGSKLPFRIRPGAPTSSIDITADGDVGIGTASPENNLHIFSSNTADSIMCLGPNCDGNPATESALNIGYAGASFGRATGFLNVRPDSGATAPNPSLRFLVANTERMIIDNNGDVGIHCNDPASDLVVASGTGANCSNPSSSMNAGDAQFTVASSRTFKEHLSPITVPDILDKIAGVDVYNYDFIDGPKDRIGLMAEDFHQIFGRGSDKYLNGNEVQLALWLAVQQLTATNRDLMKRVTDLEGRLQESSTQK